MLTAAGQGSGQLDALALTPLLSSLITQGAGHSTGLVNSAADTSRALTVRLPGSGRSFATAYGSNGRAWRTFAGSESITETVPAGGFAVIKR